MGILMQIRPVDESLVVGLVDEMIEAGEGLCISVGLTALQMSMRSAADELGVSTSSIIEAKRARASKRMMQNILRGLMARGFDVVRRDSGQVSFGLANARAF